MRWYKQMSARGNPSCRAIIRRQWSNERYRVNLSWGATINHVRNDWGKNAHFYADLEVYVARRTREGWTRRVYALDLKYTHGASLCCHVERGYKTRKEAEAMVAWLKSCIAVAGVEGILALNDRSGGNFA